MQIVPYLSISTNQIIGNIRFRGLGSTNSPIRLTTRCCHRKTSRVAFLSIATSDSRHGAVVSIISHATRRIFVPVAINNNMHAPRSISSLLHYNTSGINIGATTVGSPSLVDHITSHFNGRILILSISTHHRGNRRRARSNFRIAAVNNHGSANVSTV